MSIVLRPITRPFINRTVRSRILVASGNEILLVQTWLGRGTWGLPGGGIRSSENGSVGAARELREETGLDIPKSKLVSMGVLPYSEPKQSFDFRVAYFFARAGDAGELKTPSPWEIVDIGWFEVDKLPSDVSVATKIALKLARKNGLI